VRQDKHRQPKALLMPSLMTPLKQLVQLTQLTQLTQVPQVSSTQSSSTQTQQVQETPTQVTAMLPGDFAVGVVDVGDTRATS
jgi:biotin carboxyl carrier protein